jgi:hypothetical protein
LKTPSLEKRNAPRTGLSRFRLGAPRLVSGSFADPTPEPLPRLAAADVDVNQLASRDVLAAFPFAIAAILQDGRQLDLALIGSHFQLPHWRTKETVNAQTRD